MTIFDPEQIRRMKPGEFKVYNYITLHMEEIPGMNIRQLADAAGVSTTTVLRLCEKAGCEGYTELKYRIRQELGRRERACSYDAVPAMQFIRSSEQDGKFLRELKHAAGICEKAGLIILCGDGESGMISRYGAYLLSAQERRHFLRRTDQVCHVRNWIPGVCSSSSPRREERTRRLQGSTGTKRQARL